MSERDPMGRRALFSSPSEAAVAEPKQDGRRALFSQRKRRVGELVVHCSSCHERTPVNVVRFAVQHFPVWVWLPWRRYDRLMRCPACGKLTWLSVS